MKINKDSVPEIYQAFFKETGTTPEEFLGIVALLLAGVRVSITEEEIAEANPRWINNSSILKGWGKILPEMCDNILRNISK